MILIKIQKIIGGFMGCDVKNVRLTMATYFNISHRRATKDAKNIVGISVIKIN